MKNIPLKCYALLCLLYALPLQALSESNIQSVGNTFQFQGSAKNLTQLSVNETPIKIEEGRFKASFLLTDPTSTEVLHLKGITTEGKSIQKDILVTYTPQPLNPKTRLSLFPLNHAIVSRPTIKLTGSAIGIKTLSINKTPVKIAENGTYEMTIQLEKENTPTLISIQGKSKTGELISLIREITYKKPQKEPITPTSLSKEETHILENALTALSLSYAAYNWKINPPLEVHKLAHSDIWNRNHLWMSHEKAVLLILPYIRSLAPINQETDTLIQAINPKRDITILWVNANQSLWEMHYTYNSKEKKYTPFLWILNEKKIQPNHNSSESRTLINYFLNYPFKKIRST